MIFGKYINRYYLRHAPTLLLGILSLLMVDYIQLLVPQLYRMKKYEAAVAAGDLALAQETYKTAVKKIDSAVNHGILHKNAAARKKSQFTKKLNAMA